MDRSLFPPEFSWNDVLLDALRRAGAAGDLQLFFEQREDLTSSWLDGRSSATGTLWCGVSASRAHGPPATVHLADPAPDDVARVASLAARGAAERTGPATAADRPWTLDPIEREKVNAIISTLARRMDRHGPSVRPRVEAVLFEQRIWVADPELGCREDRRRSARLRVEVEADRSGRSARAVAETARPSVDDFHPDFLESLASRLAQRLDGAFDRRELPAGEYAAVLAPGLGGILAHEIVGHALEADTVRRGASWLAGLEGAVAPRDLRVIDDPRRGRAPWRIDDEGTEARATALVEGGRAEGLLHDRASAALERARPNGHGRRATFRDPVMPRMGCTYIAAGRMTAQEILEDVESGVYVRRMEAASVDPRSGRAVFRVTDADRIVGGRIAEPLSPYLWVVDGARALKSMNRIAGDLEFDTCIGSCHREAQTLAIGVGAPTICAGVSAVICSNIVGSVEG